MIRASDSSLEIKNNWGLHWRRKETAAAAAVGLQFNINVIAVYSYNVVQGSNTRSFKSCRDTV